MLFDGLLSREGGLLLSDSSQSVLVKNYFEFQRYIILYSCGVYGGVVVVDYSRRNVSV